MDDLDNIYTPTDVLLELEPGTGCIILLSGKEGNSFSIDIPTDQVSVKVYAALNTYPMMKKEELVANKAVVSLPDPPKRPNLGDYIKIAIINYSSTVA